MHRTFRYPLHPTSAQEDVLRGWLSTCCELYNAGLQERRDGWQKQRARITYATQTAELTEVRAADVAIAAVPVDVERSALRRLERAFDGFFRRCRAGGAPGYPRFRARRRYDSFSFRAGRRLVSGEGRSARLRVPVLGEVKVHLYRPLRGRPLDVTVRRDAVGRWWACVSCDLGAAPEPSPPADVPEDRVVGVDVGLTSLAALSTGELVPNPRHAARGAQVLARRQRVLARRKRGSRSRERARIAVARAYAHVRNQRLDHARHVAVGLMRRFDVVAFEDLNLAGLARGMLAGPVNQAAWGILRHAVACKAEEAGKRVVLVDPRGTSQECSACGAVVPKGLDVRTHRCACGYVTDRDVNAARVIRARWIQAPGAGAVYRPKGKPMGKARSSTAQS